MNVYLIGFMGSGKSYTGMKLASALGLPFVDLDTRIEMVEMRSIANIFEAEGEAYFRDVEAKTLRETLIDQPAIISCGGGTPCFFQNMDWINASGLSIYLKADVSLLVKRLQKGQEQRPLIRGLDKSELERFIASRLEAREPFYAQAKIIVIQKDNQSLLPQLLAIYQQYLGGHA